MGERKIIDEIWKKFGENVEYDDCAFVPEEDKYILFTTDFVAEGTHFIHNVNPEILGKFIVAVNLSDIAAMGGIGDYFLLSSFLPGDADFEFLSEVMKSLYFFLKSYGIRYLGGDLKESSIIGFSGFAVGHVEKNKILKRKGAKIGDIIGVSGLLGKNAASYYLWKMGLLSFEEVLKIQPKLEEGRELAGKARIAMDTSDGLISSLYQLQRINKIGFKVDWNSLPLHPLAMEVIEDYDVSLFDLLNFGGEYQLLYSADRKIIGYEIGEVVKEIQDYGGKGYESFSKTLD